MSERTDDAPEVEVEETTDELDNWFAEEEEEELDEDQSAEEVPEDDSESSTEESEEEPEPDQEDPEDDAEPPASDEGNSTKGKSEEDPYEWMSQLDPDLKQEVERLVQSDRSQRGRVAALQRQLDSVRAAQEARERTQSPEAAAKAAAGGKNIEDMDDEELAEFLEEFPSVAKNVQKLIDQKIAERVQPIEQERLQHRLEESRQALRQEATRIFNTVETGIELDDVLSSNAFRQWVAEQPSEYQQFARTAESVEAATIVLEDFAQYAEAQVEARMPPRPETAKEEPPKKGTRSADQTAARREQARRGSTPKSKSAELTNKPGQGSYEDWFDHFADGGN